MLATCSRREFRGWTEKESIVHRPVKETQNTQVHVQAIRELAMPAKGPDKTIN
jgi:hypothetical protein